MSLVSTPRKSALLASSFSSFGDVKLSASATRHFPVLVLWFEARSLQDVKNAYAIDVIDLTIVFI